MNRCMSCDGQISPGTPFVSLNLHRETFDGDKAKVIEAQLLLMWCDQCAGERFGVVCADNFHQHRSRTSPGDSGTELFAPRAASPGDASGVDAIDVYLAGLAQDDPAITEEVRDHIQSLVGDGNATFLTILLEAIRSGLTDS